MKKKIVTIIGARPQFIKTPLVSKELRKFCEEVIVHTGQHYDKNMSEVFFKELNICDPDYNLFVGSGYHGQQTGQMLIKIEKVLIDEKPDLVLIYGDTNSTLAGALVAAKMHIPVAHVEAGMRSFNKLMPEEINRVATDHISDLLLCPTNSAVKLLAKEGIKKGVYFVGDVMADIQIKFRHKTKPRLLKDLSLKPKEYILTTIHRQDNTDNEQNLRNIIEAMIESDEHIIFPVHPRTKKYIKEYGLDEILNLKPKIRMIDPLSYSEMLFLEIGAKLILTDSGGVQKEAYLAQVPCITLRKETEWVETVKTGWNRLAGAEKTKIKKLIKSFPEPKEWIDFLGNGLAHQRIGQTIRNFLNNKS